MTTSTCEEMINMKEMNQLAVDCLSSTSFFTEDETVFPPQEAKDLSKMTLVRRFSRGKPMKAGDKISFWGRCGLSKYCLSTTERNSENMQIKLEYSNALKDGKFEFTGEYEDIARAVKALVDTFDKDFNPANLDFEHVVVNGTDLGVDGLYQAEIALKEFYS